MLLQREQFIPRGADYEVGAGSVKGAADKVNKKAGKGLASAIENGEEVTEKTKETLSKQGQSPPPAVSLLTKWRTQLLRLQRLNRPPRRLHRGPRKQQE